MDILLIAIGSHGDVHPFVGIGRALAARGHEVRVAANEHFYTMIERAGLGFVQLGDEALFKRWIGDELVWHPRKGPSRVFHGISESIETVYEMTVVETDKNSLIVGSSLALGALIAAEKHGLRYATAHLGPICVRSFIELPTLPGGINFTRFPAWFKRKFWDGADQWFIDPHIAPAVNAMRSKVGLPPVKRILNDYWNSPRLTLGLWPDWFAAKQPDHPPQLRLTGFPLYDEADHHDLDPDLEEWLGAGGPPIAFTPGSAMVHGHAFFDAAAKACERIGRRGLLLTRHIEQIPGHLPPTVRHFSYAPFSDLLPRCAALVHHGGIGTTAQALRAGVPQLIMPMSHDQPDNAARVKRLGAGDSITRRFFSPSRVARKLERLITDPNVARACQTIAARFDDDRSMERTIELIEGLADG
jgi:UDP:flavonoid glycosyltransferase YjiC (YdhE family)